MGKLDKDAKKSEDSIIRDIAAGKTVKIDPKKVEEDAEELMEVIDEKIKEDKKEIKELKKDKKDLEKIEKDAEEALDSQEKPKKEKRPIKKDSTQKEVDSDDEDQDDEVDIDFSKIKEKISGFFGLGKKKNKPKKEMKQEKKEEDEDSDEEVDIDFSKIKNIFSGKKKEKEEKKESTKKQDKKAETEEDSDDEVSLDFSGIKESIKNIFNPQKKKGKQTFMERNGSLILLLLIPLFLAVFFRVQPAYLPITDDWAESTVYGYFQNQIAAQVDVQYPNLPDSQKSALVVQEFNNFLTANEQLIDEQIQGTSDYYKSQLQDDEGNTYLLAIDPYFWMRKVKNILDHGHPGDEIKDGVYWNNHMFAPNGRPVDVSFHSYFSAYIYKFVSFFNNDATLMGVFFFMPVLLSALAVIPAFFIGRKIAGNFAGFISALILAIHPGFLTRTAGGFADTDAYNVTLPLFITWLFLEAFETKDLKKKMIYSGLSAFCMALFAFTWIGSWFILDFLMGVLGIFFIYSVIKYFVKTKKPSFDGLIKEDTVKNTVILGVSFVLFTIIFLSFFFGPMTSFNFVMKAPLQPITFSQLKVVGIHSVWPNVYTTVAEQNESTFTDVINDISMGNKILFFMSILGILFLFIKDEKGKVNVKEAILLTLWFAATIYASVKGVRFLLLFVPAFSIALGICFGYVFNFASRWIAKNLQINKIIVNVTIIVLLCLLLLSPLRQANETAINEVPSMNDAWWDALEEIRLNSEPDAIINSWWDFGHWFKYIADRAVTFDGTSQGSPQAHWIGKVLLTDDEDLAVGILKMLDCSGYMGGTYAYDAAYNITKDESKAVQLIYDVVVLDEQEARTYLKETYNAEDSMIEGVVSNTHCEPPEDYFITSDDMVGKSAVWAHFGSWDFDKALMYNRLKSADYKNNKEKSIDYLIERFGFSESEAESMYFEIQSITTSDEANTWIAPWPSYASSIDRCLVEGEIVTCDAGGALIDIDLNTLDGNISTPNGVKHLYSVVLVTEDGFEEKVFKENVISDISILLIPDETGYTRLMLHNSLAKSMFTRLYYLEGHGTKYFHHFTEKNSVFGGKVIVWDVDWEGTQNNQYSFFSQENETTSDIVEETAETSSLETENAPEVEAENLQDENNITIEIQ